MHCNRVKNAPLFVLGPTRPHATGEGLKFSPQRFLSVQPRRENVSTGPVWMRTKTKQLVTETQTCTYRQRTTSVCKAKRQKKRGSKSFESFGIEFFLLFSSHPDFSDWGGGVVLHAFRESAIEGRTDLKV